MSSMSSLNSMHPQLKSLTLRGMAQGSLTLPVVASYLDGKANLTSLNVSDVLLPADLSQLSGLTAFSALKSLAVSGATTGTAATIPAAWSSVSLPARARGCAEGLWVAEGLRGRRAAPCMYFLPICVPCTRLSVNLGSDRGSCVTASPPPPRTHCWPSRLHAADPRVHAPFP
jgi:hypothetical protein